MKQKIYDLLLVKYRALLQKCYQQVFYKDSGLSAAKTFDDFLSDFYLYLYEAKPKYVNDDVKGYYLSRIKDEKALPSYLWQTFRRFLIEENRILTDMRNALSDYRAQLANMKEGESIDITLMHVGFAIAWFNQHESSEDRYLFFRSAYKHFMGFYNWPETELDDKDVASVLGITHGTLRTRTSRLCAKVKRLVNELSDALIASLNKESLDIAKDIYEQKASLIEQTLEELMGKAEKELAQYEQIISLRRSKRLSIHVLPTISAKIASTPFTGDFAASSTADAMVSDDNAPYCPNTEKPHISANILCEKEDSRKDILFNEIPCFYGTNASTSRSSHKLFDELDVVFESRSALDAENCASESINEKELQKKNIIKLFQKLIGI